MYGLGALEELINERISKITATSPEYSTCKCEKCHDTGWIETTNEEGIRFVGKCACRLAREAERRMEISGLKDVISVQTFDAFEESTKTQAEMKRVATEYVQALLSAKKGDRIPWLYIGGNPGSGKTHICTAVCGELLRHNIGVRYMQWLSDARKLKTLVNDELFDDYIVEYTGVSVLYIDDLMKQKYTDNPTFSDADIKIAFAILNARYLLNKPTIISSEWNLAEHLLSADEGVFSRVYERCKGYTIYVGRDKRNNYRMR